MRLAFFGLSLSSSWGNGHATTYRGLLGGLRQRGHAIDFFERDAEWYAHHRDAPDPPQARLHLYRDWPGIAARALACARAADAVVVGSYYPDAIVLLDELLACAGPPVCFYDMDTPITLQSLAEGRCGYLRRDQIPALDLYLSFTSGPVLSELEQHWGAKRARPLHCACDEAAYGAGRRRWRRRPPPFALTFLGTYAPDRQAKLQRLLLAPAAQLPEQRFRVAGSMFPGCKAWPSNVRYDSHLPPGEHAGFYTASRFTLNLTRQAMVEAGYSPSVRLFEAAATATAIISDPWPGLAEFFEPGVEILVAESSEAVTDLLRRISPDEAAAIGQAAHRRMLGAHTSRRRAQQLEGYLAEVSAPRTAKVA